MTDYLVLVPRNPTKQMLQAAVSALDKARVRLTIDCEEGEGL